MRKRDKGVPACVAVYHKIDYSRKGQIVSSKVYSHLKYINPKTLRDWVSSYIIDEIDDIEESSTGRRMAREQGISHEVQARLLSDLVTYVEVIQRDERIKP